MLSINKIRSVFVRAALDQKMQSEVQEEDRGKTRTGRAVAQRTKVGGGAL